ncbi:MAG: glycosyltransferase family 39 protein [Thermoplasmatota archaeon]
MKERIISFFRSRDNRVYILFFILGILVLSLGMSKYGIGLYSDSFVYINCAENLVDGKGFVHGDGSWYHQWAPLLPVVLAGPMLIGVPPDIVGVVLNLLLFGSLVVITGKVVQLKTKSGFFTISAMTLVILSRPLYVSSIYLMSELPFNVLAALSLLSLLLYLEKERRKYFWYLVAFTSLACLTRYVGITLIFTGVVVLFFHGKEKKFIKRLRDPFLYGALSPLPTVAFLVRNYIRTGTLIGDRFPSETGILENVYRTGYHLIHWFIPRWLPPAVWVPLGFVLALVFIVLFGNLLYSIRRRKENRKVMIIFGYFSIFYMAYLLVSASRVAFDPLNDRFFSPVFVPMIIILMLSLSELSRHPSRSMISKFRSIHIKGKNVRHLASVLMVMIIAASGLVVFTEIRENAVHGVGGYTTSEWVGSEILEYISENPPGGDLYSNYPKQVNYFGGIDEIGGTPLKYYQATKKPANGLEKFNESILDKDNVKIIWISISERDWYYSIEELNEIYNITMEKRFSDGQIYRMTRN